jgi:hypothetical protein
MSKLGLGHDFTASAKIEEIGAALLFLLDVCTVATLWLHY